MTGVKRRQVVANFDGGRLTSDAGVVLLREVDRRIGLIDAINECLPDPRDPRYITHEQREMLAQRIFSLALGYEDLNDQQTLRDDPALQVAAGKTADPERPLASPPTLCRLEVTTTWSQAVNGGSTRAIIGCFLHKSGPLRTTASSS